MNLHTVLKACGKMAGRTRKEKVSGEDLEAILDLLDSDFLEDVMRNSFDEAVDEVSQNIFTLFGRVECKLTFLMSCGLSCLGNWPESVVDQTKIRCFKF